jgi:tRNA A-37 threonylcarbamoyl transferase component Bud32
MDRIVGYKKIITQNDEGNTSVKYKNIDEKKWEELKKIAILLGHHRIGPEVYEIYDDEKLLIIETIIPFNEEPNETIFPTKETIKKIKSVVNRFHKLDLIHGDLNFSNIGYRKLDKNNWEPVIFDYDTIHYKGEYNDDFITWIKKGYGIETYDEYIEYEHTYQGWIY